MFLQLSVILFTEGSGRHPQPPPLGADNPSPNRQLLQRTIRILLECILVQESTRAGVICCLAITEGQSLMATACMGNDNHVY